MAKKVCLDPDCVHFVIDDSDSMKMVVNKSCPVDKVKQAESVIQGLASGKKLEISFTKKKG